MSSDHPFETICARRAIGVDGTPAVASADCTARTAAVLNTVLQGRRGRGTIRHITGGL